VRCYARSLGGCSGISLEHVVTKRIFGNSSSVVSYGMGTPDGKRIGINSAGAKILCSRHNSMLSVLDDEIVRLANAAAEHWESPKTGSVAINGSLIERWMLKLIVGIAASGVIDRRPMIASDSAIRQLFGMEPLSERFALYGLSLPSLTREWNRSVSFHALKRPGHEVDMTLFLVNDLPLLAYVGDQDPQESLRSAGSVAGIDVCNAGVIRRPRKVQLRHTDATDAPLTIEFSYGS
jgi:hypothetical protein